MDQLFIKFLVFDTLMCIVDRIPFYNAKTGKLEEQEFSKYPIVYKDGIFMPTYFAINNNNSQLNSFSSFPIHELMWINQ